MAIIVGVRVGSARGARVPGDADDGDCVGRGVRGLALGCRVRTEGARDGDADGNMVVGPRVASRGERLAGDREEGARETGVEEDSVVGREEGEREDGQCDEGDGDGGDDDDDDDGDSEDMMIMIMTITMMMIDDDVFLL
mmetsp:Transcript_27880/g.52048  ORF Transcript_27880/g.52048 Transcript_27880/m.52048 type:complete len:139 (+) Transcript_27880:689-1105(+)